MKLSKKALCVGLPEAMWCYSTPVYRHHRSEFGVVAGNDRILPAVQAGDGIQLPSYAQA
jgi:hypothetical protein